MACVPMALVIGDPASKQAEIDRELAGHLAKAYVACKIGFNDGELELL
ncbi:hypothetical protein PSTA9_01889 [Pseudomonas syringae pv. tomato]|nr:hypothetical protein PSTA9_01889 [Pseudomonas syringae pv. tomato]